MLMLGPVTSSKASHPIHTPSLSPLVTLNRTMLAAHSPLWRKHKNLVKGFVANLLHFVRQLVEPNMLGFVLKSVERSAAYFASYPKVL